MPEWSGDEARQKAVEWGYEYDDIDAVNYARSSKSIGCRWIYAGNEGNCVTCGDMDFSWSEED